MYDTRRAAAKAVAAAVMFGVCTVPMVFRSCIIPMAAGYDDAPIVRAAAPVAAAMAPGVCILVFLACLLFLYTCLGGHRVCLEQVSLNGHLFSCLSFRS